MSPSPSEKEHALEAEIARLRALLQQAGIDPGAEPPLHQPGEQLRLAQEAGGIGAFTLEIATNLLTVTPEYCRLYGLEPTEVLSASTIESLVVPEDRHIGSTVETRSDGSARPAVEYRIRKANTGELRWISRRAEFVRDAQGTPVRLVGVAQDVTERRRAEDALRDDKERIQLALNAGAVIGTWVWEVQSDRFTADERFARSFSLDPERAAQGLPMSVVVESIHPEDRSRIQSQMARAVKTGGAYRAEYRALQLDGSYLWVEANGHCVHTPDGKPARFPGVLINIDERKKGELRQAALVEVGDRLRELGDSADIAGAAMEVVGRLFGVMRAGYGRVNPALRQVEIERDWVAAPEIASVRGLHDIIQYGSYIDELERGEAAVIRDIEKDPRTASGVENLRRFGIRAMINVPLLEQGRLVAVLFLHDRVVRDWSQDEIDFMRNVADRIWAAIERIKAVVELRLANETLEQRVEQRTRERDLVEEQLRQAQKMEAVGQLTGGVAHDFNNLLQVIGGNLQLLQRDVASNAQALRRLQTAVSAVERGARLAAQLLAFSRRQPLEPLVLNLGRLVRGMDDMLRRSLGENVEVKTVVSGELWNTSVDPNQLENVILNLAINARDAMEGTGKLTIEVSNASLDERYAQLHPEVVAGQYVLLSVSDTGSGMPPEVLQRAFEPFFTTKPEGRGTGLGLSMVYGFVRQSGGHIKIYSEVGKGTTIKIYLPRALQPEAAPVAGLTGPVEGGTETILVVEDDAQVRATVVELLSELGYRVLKAVDGQSALAIIQSGVPVDLLFTDVVMPGPVRSTELARQAKELVPHIEVLFTSGYTEDAIVHGGRLDPGVNLLSKPHRHEELARKVRQLLNLRQLRLASQASQAPQRERESLGSRKTSVPIPSQRLRVLLVEDDEEIRGSTEDLLELLGHEVVAVSSAEAARGALVAGRFDVLLTDVSLPGSSGVELAREVMKRYPETRIIIASGDGSATIGGAGARLDAAVLLPKPYAMAQIQEALARVVGSR
jgi:PAS domain S-box-containing protein